MSRITARVKDEVADALEQVADETGVTKSDLIRMGARYVLDHHRELIDEDTQTLAEYKENIRKNQVNVLRAQFLDLFDENIGDLFESGADPDDVEEVCLGENGWIQSAETLGLEEEAKQHIRDRVEQYRRDYKKSDHDPREIETTATFEGVKRSGEYEEAVERAANLLDNGSRKLAQNEMSEAVDAAPPDTTLDDVRKDVEKKVYKDRLKSVAEALLDRPDTNQISVALEYAPDTHTESQVREDALTLYDELVERRVRELLDGERDALAPNYYERIRFAHHLDRRREDPDADVPDDLADDINHFIERGNEVHLRDIPDGLEEMYRDIITTEGVAYTREERAKIYLEEMDLLPDGVTPEAILIRIKDDTPTTETAEEGV